MGMMDMLPGRAGGVMAAAAFLTFAALHGPNAQGYAVVTKPNVQYVEHDGVKLTGDFYSPKGLDKAPVLIAAHGGGWLGGNPAAFQNLGPFLARNGYAVFAIRYRLAKPGMKMYPAEVYDVKAAVQFVRAKAADLGVDPARMATGRVGRGPPGVARGRCRPRAPVLQPLPRRSQCGRFAGRQGRGFVLRDLRHAGAMGA